MKATENHDKSRVQSVLTVDLAHFTTGSPAQRKAFIRDFGNSIKDFGFVILENHGVDDDLVRASYTAAEKFFALPESTKTKYDLPGAGGQRGYTRFGREHAKDQTKPDLKEFWHVGREIGIESELSRTYQRNIWPDADVPGFKPTLYGLYQKLDGVAADLLNALSEYLELQPKTLSKMAKNGNSILRLLHYPPVSQEQFRTGAIRAAAHEDINLITLLCGATDSGLEILTRSGEWLPIDSKPGQIVVDSGDMLSRVTNGVIPSTTHRVVNPANSVNTARYSMPFFVHPFPTCDLSVLPECTGPDNPAKFPPCLADEFLKQRLAEIGLTQQKY